MIIKNNDINFEFDFEKNSIYELVIENKNFYRSTIFDIFQGLKEEKSKWILVDNIKITQWSKHSWMFLEPWTLDINKSRTIINKIIKQVFEVSQNKSNYTKTLELENATKKYIIELIDSLEHDFEIEIIDDFNILEIIKSAKLNVNTGVEEPKNIHKALFTFMQVLNKILGINIFIFVSIKDYLSDIEFNELTKMMQYHNLFGLFIENKCTKSNVKTLIIDNDLCEIVV